MILNNEHIDTETKKKTGSIYTPPTESEKILLRTETINNEIKDLIDNRRIFK